MTPQVQSRSPGAPPHDSRRTRCSSLAIKPGRDWRVRHVASSRTQHAAASRRGRQRRELSSQHRFSQRARLLHPARLSASAQLSDRGQCRAELPFGYSTREAPRWISPHSPSTPASWEVALPDWQTSAAAYAAAAESQKACAAVRRHVLARAAAAGLVSDG